MSATTMERPPGGLAPLERVSEAQRARAAQPPVTMVERMTLVLDAFSGRSAPLTLEEVTQFTQLPRSTAHRILDQLVRLSWLDHSCVGYALGRRARMLGGDELGLGELRAAAAPLLHQLLLRTGMTVHLAVLDEGQVRYLDKVVGRSADTVPSRVGGCAPATSTALGKAMLCWLPAEEVESTVSGLLPPGSARSLDLSAFHQELHRIRSRHGIAYERGARAPGLASVAVAVRGPGGPIAAISLVGEASVAMERVAPLVAETARRVSLELFPGAEVHRKDRRTGGRSR